MEQEIVTITIDGEEMSDLYQDLVNLEVELDEELAAMFRLQIAIALQPDGSWSYLDDEGFRVWKPVTISAGLESGTEELISGYITHVKPSFTSDLTQCMLEVKVDLSGVVSKYIGETEKNLSRIFQEAETSNAILFFDEADALFGKRTEVSDAHDRYANIETSYLLQKMEEYEGIVILATNLRENMNEAFTRRLRFIVEFPFPDEEHRLCIWKTHFPTEAPLSEEVDYEFLARKFQIAGGNIKNIVLNAAFYAAEDGEEIRIEHILCGTRREFEKVGKLWQEVKIFSSCANRIERKM